MFFFFWMVWSKQFRTIINFLGKRNSYHIGITRKNGSSVTCNIGMLLELFVFDENYYYKTYKYHLKMDN